MAGGEPRFGTTATYMRSLNHHAPHVSRHFRICYDYIKDPTANPLKPLAQNRGKVQTKAASVDTGDHPDLDSYKRNCLVALGWGAEGADFREASPRRAWRAGANRRPQGLARWPRK